MAEKHVKKVGLGDRPRPKFDTSQLGQSSFQRVGDSQDAAQPSREAPPAKPTEGFHGQMPLPVGAVVTPTRLAPHERKALESLGWKEGQPIPGNLPDLLEQVRQEASQSAGNLGQLPPPANPSSVPPLQMPPEQRLEDLPPARRQQLQEDLPPHLQARIRAAFDEAQQLASDPSTRFQPAGEGVGDAAAGVVHRQVDVGPRVVDDREDPQYSTGEPKREPPPRRERPDPGTAEPAPQKCSHCGWDSSLPDTTEVSPEDKQSFLQAVLAGRPWQKSYMLARGMMDITLRQLTADEVDACYAQVRREQQSGSLDGPMDRVEQLTRYRMCLQLVEIRSDSDFSQFPASLEEWRAGNPDIPEFEVLPTILAAVRAEAAKTESLHRIVNTYVARFNRLAAKLEAQIDSPDF